MDAHVELTRTYKHPIDLVWSAISEAAEISAWFIKADFKAEVGYEYTFTHEDTIIRGKILNVQPPTLLVYTWVLGGVSTTVHWHLQESDEGTVLKLVHDGIEAYGDSAASWLSSFEHGWTRCVDELEIYLAKVVADGQT